MPTYVVDYCTFTRSEARSEYYLAFGGFRVRIPRSGIQLSVSSLGRKRSGTVGEKEDERIGVHSSPGASEEFHSWFVGVRIPCQKFPLLSSLAAFLPSRSPPLLNHLVSPPTRNNLQNLLPLHVQPNIVRLRDQDIDTTLIVATFKRLERRR